MHSLRFGCTSLIGRNKTGHLPQDENGYYEIVVGGLNVYNAANQYYPYEAARELFEESSSLMRRVKRGVLRAEYGHPKRNGLGEQAFISRVMNIHEEMVCGHHKELWLDFDRVKDDQGRPVIAIMSRFLPGGPYGEVLSKQFKNKDENVCFSIRSFTEDTMSRGGIVNRALRQVITFDYVNEPGIIHAEKYRSPALEGLYDEEIVLHRDDFIAAAKIAHRRDPVATESVTMSLDELFKTMKWSVDQQALDEFQKHKRPKWLDL